MVVADPAWVVTSDRGGWAFRNRSWIPIPLGIALIFLSWGATPSPVAALLGLCVIGAGQALRFWAVRHIGPISRTRDWELGPLVTTGPYALTRNPLYVGNWCLWTGAVLVAGVFWMLPIVWLVFAVQYGEIVAWEERLIGVQLTRYREYASRVPRWWPTRHQARACLAPTSTGGVFTWREVLRSERSTLITLFVALSLLLYPLARWALLT